LASQAILAIDQGTTGTTCLVAEGTARGVGRVLGRGYAEVPQHFPQPGWVEHDLEDIWHSVLTSAEKALTQAGVANITAVGITNQRETTGLWERKTGKPVGRAIVWQDRRTADICTRLRKEGHSDHVRKQTGLVLDPYFSATKVMWKFDIEPALRRRAAVGDLCFGTIDTWLLYRLTGGKVHATDATNASRTLLYDIHKSAWSQDLAKLFGDIPMALLPEVKACNSNFGETRGVPGIPDGVPITGIAGDQQAALFGQACFDEGMVKCTYGTGAFALVNTGAEAKASAHGLLTTVAWQLGDVVTYALEGSVFMAGATVQWLRDGMRMFDSSHEVEALAAKVSDTGGVVVVPAMTGLGAPHWRPEARGLICGITRGTERAHIARAALEGIALQVYDLLDAMRRDSGEKLLALRVDGGATANDLLMQFQSDVMGLEIHRPAMLETTALGAASMAALGVGLVPDLKSLAKGWKADRLFKPERTADDMAPTIARWHDALAKA
jgi:glycerol kinase